MDTLKIAGIGGLVALVVALGVTYLAAPQSVKEVVREVVREIREVGAFPGPKITEACLTVNGARECWTGQKFVNATSTPCALFAPNSTSTLLSGTVVSNTASSSAITIGFYKAQNAAGTRPNPTATTTTLGSEIIIPANTKFDTRATTTNANVLAEDDVFAPNAILVFGIKGADTISTSLTGIRFNGHCAAKWLVHESD